VRLVDFLIRLLEAQAQTLQRLAALFGEDILLEILEAAGPDDEEKPSRPTLAISPGWFGARGNGGGSPYSELEGAVRELKLSPVLQFHLWAYPVYRVFIESDLDLSQRVVDPQALVEAALGGAKLWMENLPIAKEFRNQAERAAEVPWLRFRTGVLKELGQRPIGVV
jgi:hypothetical protein